MSSATASAIDRDAPGETAATRANYERFALLLGRIGHVPGPSLTHLDFRLLIFLLGQKPGHYAAHHHTIATACTSNITSIRQSLTRLRDAGLVFWDLIPPHHALPSGSLARTNVNRYRVHLPRLAALLERSAKPPATAPESLASTLPKSDASTLPISDASSRTDLRSEQKPLPPTPPPLQTPPRGKPIDRAREEAVVPIQISQDLEPIRESWKSLDLGVFDRRSQRALENRLAEGATLEQLEAAVAGASVDEWLRRRAKVPFAVVFASLASVERFAHEGRKVLDLQAAKARSGAPRGQEEGAAGDSQDRETEDPMAPTADELRQSLPELAPAAAKATTGKVDMIHELTGAGSSSALGAAAATPAEVRGRLPRAMEPPGGVPTTQRPRMRCSSPPPELAALLQALSGSMRPGRDQREETPQDRRLREQADFDRRRLELVAKLRALEE